MEDALTGISVASVFSEDGHLSRVVDGFQARQSQIDMAEIIEQAIKKHHNAIIEAGTGIGKSYAYLVPAFTQGCKTLISTGTKNLQDQLYKKDIPIVQQAIAKGYKTALLKGRSNYACHYRIQKYQLKSRFQTPRLSAVFAELLDWLETSVTGDIAEFSNIPERDSLWFYATSTADNCLGQECPNFNDCFVLKARKNAFDADLVVINHHLFFSDLALRDEGFGELLPDMDLVIFDEAHQLPDIASHFFGKGMTMRQLMQLTKDIMDAQLMEAPDAKELVRQCHQTQKTIADLRLALGDFPQKGEWQIFKNAPKLKQATDQLGDQLSALEQVLDSTAARGKELLLCLERLQEQIALLKEIQAGDSESVVWYEWNEQSFRIMVTPVDVSQNFQKQLEQCQFKTQIYTSATLSSQHSFDYFKQRLGLANIEAHMLDSPFNYPKQASLYLPQHMPAPSHEQFVAKFCEQAIQLIEHFDGNTFVLFTSYWLMQQAANIFKSQIDNPLFIQGEMQRSDLLQHYLHTKRAVLLGTSSFWEGIDVKGDKLQCVIIDKLPFKSPADPVYKKRLQLANKTGNAFMDIQVPEATIALKQGVGRLIRDTSDTGVVMLADNRLTQKSYGDTILDSLPAMKRVRSIADILKFNE